jgi:integrase
MAVNYYLEKRTDKAGDAPIRVSVMICGVRLVTSTGYSINPQKWDSERQRVKQGASNSRGILYSTINAHLASIESQATSLENRCLTDGSKVTKDTIRENIATGINRTPTIKASREKSLLDRFDEFVKESGRKRDWTEATYTKFATLRSHIVSFKDNPSFEDFNEAGLDEYVEYMRHSLGFLNSTIGKQMGFLKWFLRWANAKGYNQETAFLNYRVKAKTADNTIVFLSWPELMTVYNFEFPETKQYLSRVRDVFCFCCFTGLRYSDVRNLRKSDIKEDSICITTQKTADTLVIETNKYARGILDKYSDFVFKDDRALPVISNQKMNAYLKELGELCGIDEPIRITYYRGNERIDVVHPKYELLGTHTGRRTFISNALILGIPPHVVMRWTGHSDYSAMRPYIAVAEREKAKEMEKFNTI